MTREQSVCACIFVNVWTLSDWCCWERSVAVETIERARDIGSKGGRTELRLHNKNTISTVNWVSPLGLPSLRH